MNTYDSTDLDRVIRAWLEASAKLGIKVIAPYTLSDGNQSLRCLAYLPDFGSPNGMVVAPLTSPALLSDRHLHELAQKKGLFCSSIDPLGWAQYDETAFKDALVDWGFFGPDNERPAWLPHTGTRHVGE